MREARGRGGTDELCFCLLRDVIKERRRQRGQAGMPFGMPVAEMAHNIARQGPRRVPTEAAQLRNSNRAPGNRAPSRNGNRSTSMSQEIGSQRRPKRQRCPKLSHHGGVQIDSKVTEKHPGSDPQTTAHMCGARGAIPQRGRPAAIGSRRRRRRRLATGRLRAPPRNDFEARAAAGRGPRVASRRSSAVVVGGSSAPPTCQWSPMPTYAILYRPRAP